MAYCRVPYDEAVRLYREAKAARVTTDDPITHNWRWEHKEKVPGGYRLHIKPIDVDA